MNTFPDDIIQIFIDYNEQPEIISIINHLQYNYQKTKFTDYIIKKNKKKVITTVITKYNKELKDKNKFFFGNLSKIFNKSIELQGIDTYDEYECNTYADINPHKYYEYNKEQFQEINLK